MYIFIAMIDYLHNPIPNVREKRISSTVGDGKELLSFHEFPGKLTSKTCHFW